MHQILKDSLTKIVKEKGLELEKVEVYAAPLSPEEAIGNPQEKDYPLVLGKERLMEAHFKGSKGHAFTDMHGDFSGSLSDVVAMELEDNFKRAIFISTLNAVMRHLGLADKTVHCKNEEPRKCAQELVKHIEQGYGCPKIAFIGFQPRMVEELSKRFELKVIDMDEDNIGKEKFGVRICDPRTTGEHLQWCDIAIVTGTTIVNNTIAQFETSKPVIFYGVTIAGVARLLRLNHFCPFSK